MKYFFDLISNKCSEVVTKNYSTSFSFGISFLNKPLRKHIYNIYGFVRLADEIVDSFHEYDKEKLLIQFKEEALLSIENKISLNPILNSFQQTVNSYNIDLSLIVSFLKSMEMDLIKKKYNEKGYDEYIYGSAEVVGLMCLSVFVDGNKKKYDDLKPFAMSLGSAFQKVNFLRDIKDDFETRGRVYFPHIEINKFSDKDKTLIEDDIKKDFDAALLGIKKLPKSCRGGVYLAYIYYCKLFRKISSLPYDKILQKRIRVSNFYKMLIMLKAYFKNKFNLI